MKRLHQVPYSSGRDIPTINVPADACDCHHHIYDPVRFPYDLGDTRNQPPATIDCYRLLQKRLGITRNVIIQASAYGTDNSCLLHALQEMGQEKSRGVAVCKSNVSEDELSQMHRLGVRGLRINLASKLKINSIDEIVPLSEKIKHLGWHMQFWIQPNEIEQISDVLGKIACPVVFDHRGHIPQPEGCKHPAFKIIADLLDSGKGWVKLSGLCHDSIQGAPYYEDTVEVGRAYVKIAPERIVWGTDWPHPSSFSNHDDFPDDAKLLDLLLSQAMDEETMHKILVDNPAVLYGF
ncbi:amidohydrolase family protein [Veillonella seminalis]|uniref:amidohydrolase family protein n=1 Tax=Veillonella seminalis TaxID=1502943 RepID=UPI00402AACC6